MMPEGQDLTHALILLKKQPKGTHVVFGSMAHDKYGLMLVKTDDNRWRSCESTQYFQVTYVDEWVAKIMAYDLSPWSFS